MTDLVKQARELGGFSPEAELCSLMADEIERLREALRECANYLEEQTGIAYNYLREPFDDTTTRRLMRDMGRIRKARAALGEKE